MEKILKTYLRRLTNLSGNNRSLLLLRLISDQFLDLHDLDFSAGHPSFHLIEQLIAKKDKIKLCDEFDARDTTVNANSQKLRKISRIENFIFQERGAKDLYVGWPFVRGKFSDGTLVRCPLIFFPVSLTREKQAWYLEQRKDVNITLNKTFLLGYAHYNDTQLDEELIEAVLNDLDSDSTVFRTQLYEILKESNLELNFNQQNFMDKLQVFSNYKKAQYDSLEKSGVIKLHPEAVLGIFPQAGSYLMPDYMKLLGDNSIKDISEFFSARVKDDPEENQNIRFSDQVKEETTFTPFDMDASQEHALKLVKKGNSLTVQGPPGTGKSQLICNLISDYIARGKNVLLVCQKRAALDVVYQRLQKQELHDFIGLVHDFKNDRKSIFEQIARQVDSLDDYRQKNNGFDAIQLERSFIQASRKIDQIVEELEEFKKALFDEEECGKSIKELYLTSNPDQPSISLNQEYRQYTYDVVPEFLKSLSQYLDYHRRFTQKESFWNEGPSFADFTTQDLIKIKDIVNELEGFNSTLKEESKSFSASPLDFESCLHFLTHIEDLGQLKSNLDNDLVYQYYQHMIDNDPKEDQQWLSTMERTLLQCFKGPGAEISLKSEELGRFQESLEHAIKARKGLFSWIRWRLFSADKIFVTRVLVSNELKGNKEGLEILMNKIDNRLNYEHIVSQIEATNWLKDFPKTYRKIDIQNWFFYQKLALKCILLTKSIRTLNDILPAKNFDRHDYVAHLGKLITFLEKIPTQMQLWSRYISEKQVRSILLGKVEQEKVSKELTEQFDALVEYHKIDLAFSSEQRKIISTLLEEESSNEAIIKKFENSLALAWIDHIEIKYPSLRSVSSFRLDHLTQELQEAINEKKNVSQEILLLKSRERTYENLEYNRLNNLVTYKDLYHQVTKRRKIWPIRRVVSQFHEEIFSLLPCWLASPESASAIFPMEEIFDLVIFDEASQCFAERGIPAMYRGKQVVIAGDDKQLQPNDLYRVRWEDDDDETPELEVDSLLSLAKQYLIESSLRGHYRSKSLELIEFSNVNFYKGQLKLLPEYHQATASKPAIEYLKTDGVWQNNSNLKEASLVIDLIETIQNKTPEKTIGIVTFNVTQQATILDLLDEKMDVGKLTVPDSLFVKNIENVQGDERDIIIFSTAYAPDADGKMQLRFGSLNQAGGENRLNVAITRAKERIYIVTSLLPHQLDTENTANDGPKLLKAYLQYAKSVSDGNWQPNSLENQSRSRDWYLRNLLERDYGDVTVKKTLPFSDLTINKNQQPKGLILTDDDLFFDTLSAKEAHSYRQSHFMEMNWPYTQFYTREYWLNRDQANEKLEKFIHRVSD
ncbi:AAA domain-containing protein [Marinoscillum pacificum]|uniref:AAA domain-containing protein n=1 Tax=Marinoscillum pacificum TaxID=392723 RepID=UPI002157309B|nr:AAA domain-containing protein [Marinoscillum pacificum]